MQNLTAPKRAIDGLLASAIQILTVPPALISAATQESQATGLLTNDALIVAVMRDNGLADLASRDADFDHVAGVTRYAPA